MSGITCLPNHGTDLIAAHADFVFWSLHTSRVLGEVWGTGERSLKLEFFVLFYLEVPRNRSYLLIGAKLRPG